MARVFGAPPAPPYPKDGINDHVIRGAATVDPARRGTKAAAWYRSRCSRARPSRCALRLRPAGREPRPPRRSGRRTAPCSSSGAREADAFYAELAPAGTVAAEAPSCARPSPACSGASSSTTTTSPAGSTATPASRRRPPSGRHGRNARWRTFEAFDILSMPDVWEYPWFAAWDSAFHCVALAHVDPAFAKYQLILLCREWFQHPDGALPAYEWAFDDVNPPVQAWAALEVYRIDGSRDREFLVRVFAKLL